MNTNSQAPDRSKRNEIIIAVIGLIAATLTGVLSNWDKIFHNQSTIEATYSGYRPTGNFETEFRYFVDISGERSGIEFAQKHMLQAMKTNLITQHPEDAENIGKIVDVAEKDSINFDDIIRELIPVYQKHYSLEEIQELNKFYSTEVMQNMVKKAPLLAQDIAPIQAKMIQDYLGRFLADVQAVMSPPKKMESPSAPAKAVTASPAAMH